MFVKRVSISRPDHDLWHRWPNGWRLYSLLSDEGLSVQEITEDTGLKIETVRRILNRLRGLNLAQRDERGWTVLEADLASSFIRKRRERRHRDERALWAQSRSALMERAALGDGFGENCAADGRG